MANIYDDELENLYKDTAFESIPQFSDDVIKCLSDCKKQGIKVYEGVAEQLPFKNKTFDFVLLVTTICFVDDLKKSFKEAYRVLKTDGFILIGFVNKEGELGKLYQLKREKSKFYKDATFYSAEEVIDILRKTNFGDMIIKQTVFTSSRGKLDSIEDGYGKGSFVIIKANKK